MAHDISIMDDNSTSPGFDSGPGPISGSDMADDGDVVHICKQCMTARSGEDGWCKECGASLVPIRSVRDSYLGETVGEKYKLVEQIGAGGMGEVYLGVNEPLDQRVAVKFLSRKYTENEQVIMRFLNEARSYCRVTHPNAVTLLDYGQHDDGALYIITEFIEGVSLTDAVQEHGAFGPAKALSVTAQCCDVLTAAHPEGIIHRDLKPDNIMLMPASRDRYVVKVLDFGIAKIVDDEGTALTKTGSVFGTPEFMSPEQAEGRPVDPRSDLYALGIILFYLSTARLPFEGESQFSILQKHISEAPPKASKIREDLEIPSEIEAIIERCLSKEREDRFPDAEALLAELEKQRARFAGDSSGRVEAADSGRGGEEPREPAGQTIELADILGERELETGYPAGFRDVDSRADTALPSEISALNPSAEFDGIDEELGGVDLSGEKPRKTLSLPTPSSDGLRMMGAGLAVLLVGAIVGWQVWSTAEPRRSLDGLSVGGATAVEASADEEKAREGIAESHAWLDEATVSRARRRFRRARQAMEGVNATSEYVALVRATERRIQEVVDRRDAFMAAIDEQSCRRADRVGVQLLSVAPKVEGWVDRRVSECAEAAGIDLDAPAEPAGEEQEEPAAAEEKGGAGEEAPAQPSGAKESADSEPEPAEEPEGNDDTARPPERPSDDEQGGAASEPTPEPEEEGEEPPREVDEPVDQPEGDDGPDEGPGDAPPAEQEKAAESEPRSEGQSPAEEPSEESRPAESSPEEAEEGSDGDVPSGMSLPPKQL